MSLNIREIYPGAFFSIPTPTSPWFSVQFRTKLTNDENIETANIWEELSVTQNTFIKSISIEDNGGSKKLTLVLFDRFFERIENLVMGSLFATRATNELYSKEPEQIKKDDLNLDFIFQKQNLTNIRVRIGYADLNTTSDNGNESDYFETISSGDEFEERVNSIQTVIRSPWIYFMINGITNEVTDDGLQMTVSGLSLSTNALTSLKLIQQFSKIVGKPKELINNIASILSSIRSSKIRILPFGSGSDEPQMENANDEIELFLGGEPRIDSKGNAIIMYKTMAELFNDICSKIPPKNLDTTIKDEENDKEATSSENYSNYSYYVSTDGSGNENIIFYYPNPQRSQQNLKRVYDWRETANTIVKNCNIQTATDFAIMSQKLLTNTPNAEKREIDLIPEKANDDNYSSSLGVKSIVDFYNIKEEKNFSFISDVIDIKEPNDVSTEKTYINQLKNLFLKNINRQVFKGTIEIPGDPFYFFSKKLRPFEYIIKLNIMRPSEDGTTIKSYLTGNYVVSSINHSVDESGYKTILGVSRYPLKEEKTEIKQGITDERFLFGFGE